MLVPKCVKHRREFRGKMRAVEVKGQCSIISEYGLRNQPLDYKPSNEAARIAMTLVTWNVVVRLIRHLLPHKSYTAKAIGVRS